MALKAFEDFASEPLAFPIGKRVYVVPALGYREGIRLQQAIAGGPSIGTPEDEWRLVLGSAWDEMTADNVPLEALSRAALATMADYQYGRDAAVKVWESDPEALAVALTAATQTSPTLTPSTSTAAVTKTRTPASTSGTRTSRTTSKGKAKARASQS